MTRGLMGQQLAVTRGHLVSSWRRHGVNESAAGGDTGVNGSAAGGDTGVNESAAGGDAGGHWVSSWR